MHNYLIAMSDNKRKRTLGDYLSGIFVILLTLILIPIVFVAGGVVFKFVLIAAGITLLIWLLKSLFG